MGQNVVSNSQFCGSEKKICYFCGSNEYSDGHRLEAAHSRRVLISAALTGCSTQKIQKILYFKASNTNPDVGDTLTISWSSQGFSSLYLQENGVEQQRLNVDDLGWGNGERYPMFGNKVVSDSGTMVLLPPQVEPGFSTSKSCWNISNRSWKDTCYSTSYEPE